MLDGTIETTQSDGTDTHVGEFAVWTGSSLDGAVSGTTCLGWTSSTGSQDGTHGSTLLVTSLWLDSIAGTCSDVLLVRCIGSCAIETNCTDGLDDDGDGATDCADHDCTHEPDCPEDCMNSVDDDGDGLVDCVDEECVFTSFCQQTAAKNAVFVVEATHDGNLQGTAASAREGADAWCRANLPVGLPASCAPPQAFLSSDATDELQSMPANHGYDAALPLFWWHTTEQRFYALASDWADMLNGDILSSQLAGTGITGSVWSGSRVDGRVSGDTCLGWTAGTSGSGALGGWTTTNLYWLTGALGSCVAGRSVRCVADCR